MFFFSAIKVSTVKPLNSVPERVLKYLSVIERCPLLGDNFRKIVTFGTKRFVCYSWYVRYLGCPLWEVSLYSHQNEILNFQCLCLNTCSVIYQHLIPCTFH